MVTEDAKEDFDNAGLRVSQRCAVGIAEERSFDQAAIQNAEGGNFAFFDLHMTPKLGVKQLAECQCA